MSAEVIDWAEHKEEPVATCVCGSTEFYIRLNAEDKILTKQYFKEKFGDDEALDYLYFNIPTIFYAFCFKPFGKSVKFNRYVFFFSLHNILKVRKVKLS